MAKQDNQWIWIIGIIIIGIVFAKYSSLGAIGLQSPSVQYYDSPIIASFQTNLINPQINTYFNDGLVNSTIVQSACANNSANYSCINFNINYRTTSSGIFTIIVKSANDQELYTIQVKQPYIISTNDILTNLSTGQLENITINTFDENSKPIDVDSILLNAISPDKSSENVQLTRTDIGIYRGAYNYKNKGQYNMQITATKEGYTSYNNIVFTSVLKGAGISIWIWLALGFLILIIIGGFLIKR